MGGFSDWSSRVRYSAHTGPDSQASGDQAVTDRDLVEWNYGEYEGLRTAEILGRARPDWQLFRDGCTGGESQAEVGARADGILNRDAQLRATCCLFERTHLGGIDRAMARRRTRAGRYFILDASSFSALGYEHNLSQPVIQLWNDTHHLMHH